MATGTVEEVAQEVLDSADTVLDNAAEAVEVARTFTQRDLGHIVGGLGVGAVVGFAGGYFLLKRNLQTKFDQLVNEEVAGMREHYRQKLQALEQREEKSQLVPELEKKVEELEYKKTDPREGGGPVPYHLVGEKKEEEAPEQPEEPQTQNVFEERGGPEADGILELAPGWNYEEELKNRNPTEPYVIHQDEHREGPGEDEDYDKVHLTYFEGDDILSDDRDQVVDERDKIVGVANLSKFGHGSGDPNIVYIRNDQLACDIEVVRSTGKYATEVHGFQDDELTHSSMRRRLPRRSDIDDMER